MLHTQGDLLQMYSPNTSVSWLIIQGDSSTGNVANKTLGWCLWHKSLFIFSQGITEERSISLKIERGLMGMYFKVVFFKGITVSSKVYYIFLKVVESTNIAVISRWKQLSWVVDKKILKKLENVLWVRNTPNQLLIQRHMTNKFAYSTNEQNMETFIYYYFN